MCEPVTFQNGVKISEAKTDSVETQKTNKRLKFIYILIFKCIKRLLLFHFNLLQEFL